MMRSDDLLRPIDMSGSPRLPGKTLYLAGEYLRLTRDAALMSRTTFRFFKALQEKRRDRRVRQADDRATNLWDELYLRFRPVISAALVRGSVPYSTRYARTEAVNKLIRELELLVEKRQTDNCFAELLWNAVNASAVLGQASANALRTKFHVRAVLDECHDAQAVTVIEMTCFLRGEVGTAAQHSLPLTDLELDKLKAACKAVADCLIDLGFQLDHVTAGVLTNSELLKGDAAAVVESWVK